MGASSSHHVSNPHPFLNNIYSDHGTLHDLFTSYKTSIRQEAQRQAADKIVKELCILLQTDDVTFIPFLEREITPGGGEYASRLRRINRSILEKCEIILFDLQNLESNLSNFHQHMNELQGLCEEHVAWEEKECLPRMQEQLDKSKLDMINLDYNQTKKMVPSRPILGAPIGSGVAGAAAGGAVGGVAGGAGVGAAGGAGVGVGSGSGVGAGAGSRPGSGSFSGSVPGTVGGGSSGVNISSGSGTGGGVGTYAPIVGGPSGAQGIPGCGPSCTLGKSASGASGMQQCGCTTTGMRSGSGSMSGSGSGSYSYGSGNKAALLACRDPNDPAQPERVQGEYGSRS
jgi:hypothetical protein